MTKDVSTNPPARNATTGKAKAAEDGSVNSLGSIPSGRLLKPSAARLRRLQKMQKLAKGESAPLSIAGRLLAGLHEIDGAGSAASGSEEPPAPAKGGELPASQQYKKLVIKSEFDVNLLPDLKIALVQALGSEVGVKFDSGQNCFYVDGNDDAVKKVIDVFKTMGIDVALDSESTPSTKVTPGADNQVGQSPMSQDQIQPAMSASKEGNEEAGDMGPLVADDGEEPEGEEGDGDPFDPTSGTSDKELFSNGRLNDIMHRLLSKIGHAGSSQRQADLYKRLLFQVIQSVETKNGAPMAILSAAKSFWKSEF